MPMEEAQKHCHLCSDCQHFDSRQGTIGECMKRRMATWADCPCWCIDFEPRKEDVTWTR